MLLRGHRTELVSTKDEVILDGTEDFWILSDDHGEMGDPCHVYLCQCSLAGGSIQKTCLTRDIEEAKRYHDGRKRLRAWYPLLSLGGWRQVALVREIWYLRDHPPVFRHVFSPPVRLYVSSGLPLTYKLTLPKGCILNDHGFVEPLANQGHHDDEDEGRAERPGSLVAVQAGRKEREQGGHGRAA